MGLIVKTERRIVKKQGSGPVWVIFTKKAKIEAVFGRYSRLSAKTWAAPYPYPYPPCHPTPTGSRVANRRLRSPYFVVIILLQFNPNRNRAITQKQKTPHRCPCGVFD